MKQKSGTDREPILDGAHETEICLHCLEPNPEGTHFCRDCGSPMSAHASTGPFEGAISQGYVLRTAAERTSRPVVLAGVLLLFLPIAAVGGYLMAFAGSRLERFVGFGIALIGVSFVTRSIHAYRRNRRSRPLDEPLSPNFGAWPPS